MRTLISMIMLLLAVTLAHAHSFHQSTAEAEYNAQTKTLEVSLTVFINDLELALIRHTERLMSLEKTPAAELDAAIQSYLAKTFIVTDAAGKPTKLHWIGRQLDPATDKSVDPTVTLYFEIPLPNGMANITFHYTVLTDLFEDQSNFLHLRSRLRKAELRFNNQDSQMKLGVF